MQDLTQAAFVDRLAAFRAQTEVLALICRRAADALAGLAGNRGCWCGGE
jgi:hypothetical protein